MSSACPVHLPSTILHGTPITLLMASLSYLFCCSSLLTSRALNTPSAVTTKHSALLFLTPSHTPNLYLGFILFNGSENMGLASTSGTNSSAPHAHTRVYTITLPMDVIMKCDDFVFQFDTITNQVRYRTRATWWRSRPAHNLQRSNGAGLPCHPRTPPKAAQPKAQSPQPVKKRSLGMLQLATPRGKGVKGDSALREMCGSSVRFIRIRRAH